MRIYCSPNFYEQLASMDKMDLEQKSIWHATLFEFDGSEYVLFTEHKTKFSICLSKMTPFKRANMELEFLAELLGTLKDCGYKVGEATLNLFVGICCVKSSCSGELFEYQVKVIDKLLVLMKESTVDITYIWVRQQINKNFNCLSDIYQMPIIALYDYFADVDGLNAKLVKIEEKTNAYGN